MQQRTISIYHYPDRPKTFFLCVYILAAIYRTHEKTYKGKVFPVLNLIKHYAMKAYGEVDV
jgi:hypothetical protein